MSKTYQQLYYLRNKEKIKKRSRNWELNNRDRIIELRAHPDRKAAKAHSDKQWVESNRERSRAIKAKWQKANRKKRSEAEARRRELIKIATPRWANMEEIKKFYKNKPAGMTVDHIYPLKGKSCCGLHVVENLQYISMSSNILKSNKMPSFGLDTKEPR